MQIIGQLFSISLSLPKPIPSGTISEMSYGALSSLEDVIAILRSVSRPQCFFFVLAKISFFNNLMFFHILRTLQLIHQKYLTGLYPRFVLY